MESLVLEDALGVPIFEVTYRDSWYRETDGDGYSLVLVDLQTPRELWSEPESCSTGLLPPSAAGCP